MTDSTIKEIANVFRVDADAWKPDPKMHRRRSIVREFSLNTSTHGIPGIARSQSIPNRIFWTISLLCFTGIMIYFITETIRVYFAYPTQTSVSTKTDRSQSFPAVSICNYAPVRMDTFIKPFINFTNSRNLTNTTNTETITLTQANYIRDYFQYLFNSEQSVEQFLFPLQSILLSCTYNGGACNSSDFIPFASSTYGRCYTFNAQMKNQDNSVRKTTDNGESGKLQLLLYTHSHQYVPYISEEVSSGMIAMIHDNTELPLIEQRGINLEPGRKHKLSFRKRTYQYLQSPYSDCTTQIPKVMQIMFNAFAGADYAYSTVLCYTLCIQAYVYNQCDCVDPYEWSARSVYAHNSSDQIIIAPLCNTRDLCYTKAKTRITNTESIWNQFCSHCTQSCSLTEFTVTTSSVAAPSDTQLYVTKNIVEQLGIELPKNWNQTWSTEIPKNFVSLEVVCETRRVEVYDDTASISWVDVLSNVGGHTGLWIGISFLSIMELVEMAYRLIRYQCYLLKRRLQK